MRRMNSVCFVQSRRTFWDTTFNSSSDVTRRKKWCFITDKTVVLLCADFDLQLLWSTGSQVEVKVFVCLNWLIFNFSFYPRVCECALLFPSQYLYLTPSPFPVISFLQWTRTQREVPDQVVSRCPPAATSSWALGWTATSPEMTDRKIGTRLGGRKRRNLKGIKRGRKTRTKIKPRKACWRAWAKCSGRNETELNSKS